MPAISYLKNTGITMNLVIVESPAKAKTIKKYLGKDFDVYASYGHVRDLVPKEGAVDPNNHFAMKYQVIERNDKHVKTIISKLKNADALYLATDPDREGEAISWHLYELLNEKKKLKNKTVHRVVFNEITKKAVQDAVANPRELSLDLVNAQQARRALDYLVGFNLSPLLWKKIRRGLSAGRVQSPALRLICEREAEIQKFESQEYWSIHLEALKNGTQFSSKLIQLNNKKVEQFTITSDKDQEQIVGDLLLKSSGKCRVGRVDKKKRTRNPAPPFTTSTLQQEAVRKLGFTTSRTMRIAQQLYEGISLAEGTVGLITYMRTDSFSLSNEALGQIRHYIKTTYDENYLPSNSIGYKTKSKNAQEAHEAIRPTDIQRVPAKIKQFLTPEQFKLYEIIWKRAIACQMTPAQFDAVSIDLEVGKGESIFRANGQTLRFPGFMALYIEGDDDKEDDTDDKKIPDLEIGEELSIKKIYGSQHFTEPPPRFSEASLVKTLEEYGIGRPSTYASIITTLVDREYVELENKRFHPTDVGRVVARFLTQHFPRYVDYDFTANLEDSLDEISRGEMDWLPLMEEFWTTFKNQVDDKMENVSRDEAIQARQLGTDEKTGKPISVRMGRYGPFVQIGTREDEDKPRFAGLRPGQKMDKITREEALALFQLPRMLGETPEGEEVSANIGRFGPYVRYGKKFVSLKE